MITITFELDTIAEAAFVTAAVDNAVRAVRAVTNAAPAANGAVPDGTNSQSVSEAGPAAAPVDAQPVSILVPLPAAPARRGPGRPRNPTPTSTPPVNAPAGADKAPPSGQQEQAPVAAVDPLFSVTVVAATQPVPVAPQQVDPAPGVVVPSLKDVQDAIEAVFKAKQAAVTMATTQRWGVLRGRDVLEADRAEFIAYCKDVISGAIDPVTSSDMRKHPAVAS